LKLVYIIGLAISFDLSDLTAGLFDEVLFFDVGEVDVIQIINLVLQLILPLLCWRIIDDLDGLPQLCNVDLHGLWSFDCSCALLDVFDSLNVDCETTGTVVFAYGVQALEHLQFLLEHLSCLEVLNNINVRAIILNPLLHHFHQ